jgi:hypothetical protein
VRTARRYRTVQVRAAQRVLTAADPLLDGLRRALDGINPPKVCTKLTQVGAGPASTRQLADSAGA